MTVYYVDPVEGKPHACGLSEEEAVCTNKELDVRPGDTVLFKRGTLIRDRLWNVSGEEGAPVTYGAYGEGKPPVFCGSVDVSDPKDWAEIRKNVWKCLRFLDTEACNFVFNDEECGALKWEEAELSENGDWWDSGFCSDGENAEKAHVTLLYCEKNPGIFYRHIECVLHKNRVLASTGHDMVIQDLDFCNNGVHGIAGEEGGRNLLIKNCGFYRIGGCVWSRQQKIRFGNGVECWNIAENVTVENCTFDDIYDSAVTHQGGSSCKPANGFTIRNNHFSRCGMAAYEQRDLLPLLADFSGNECLDAGKGFSHLRTEIPRRSEIWPQPMGHHIFLWRIEKETEGSRFSITDNTFGDAPYGAAVYSIISQKAEAQIVMKGNRYQMDELKACKDLIEG